VAAQQFPEEEALVAVVWEKLLQEQAHTPQPVELETQQLAQPVLVEVTEPVAVAVLLDLQQV
jgi:hypothetical protein